MLLAIDTATRWLGLALHDGQAIVAELGWQATQTQTVDLAPALVEVFGRAGITASDLTGIGVAIGPGSYTGLRVGLAMAKGLSLAHHVPLAGVPTLDIVAAGVGELPGLLVIVAEAGRSRVCAGRYRWQGRRGWRTNRPPDIITWEALLASLGAGAETESAEAVTFAGEIDAAASRAIRQAGRAFRALPAGSSVRRAGHLAQIAWEKVRRNRADDPATLAPVYLRDPAGLPLES